MPKFPSKQNTCVQQWFSNISTQSHLKGWFKPRLLDTTHRGFDLRSGLGIENLPPLDEGDAAAAALGSPV